MAEGGFGQAAAGSSSSKQAARRFFAATAAQGRQPKWIQTICCTKMATDIIIKTHEPEEKTSEN